MRANYYRIMCSLILVMIAANLPEAVAQTPGFIYKTATAGGSKVLDPNQDGYISTTKAGFTGGKDEGASNSEIPYRPFPALTTEPIGDLNTGTTGGHTDLVPPTTPLSTPSTGSPIATYFDGTNLLFRVRLGSSSTSPKGYSVLIDSDQTFTGTGANPGFEYEVLLAASFAVQVIKHTPTGSSTIFSGSVDQYSQRSVAASTGSGNADYFYDFYVPLTAFQGGITAATPLRMSGITITSAQSGLTGTVSDVGGVNFQAYNYDAPSAWRALINGFPPTSLTSIQTTGFAAVTATAPVVSGPITANSTTISGTSVEAAGSVVTVLRNGVAICGNTGQPACPTVSSTGTWTLSGLSSTLLTAGDVITARVTPSGKTISPVSNSVTVISGVCTATPAPVLTGLASSGNTSKQFVGTTTLNQRQKITIYNTSGTLIGTYDYTPSGTGPTFSWTTPAFTITENNYYATTTPLDASGNNSGCESLRSNQLCFRNGQNPGVNTEIVSITSVAYDNATFNSTNSTTWSEVPTNLATISGTVAATSTSVSTTVVLFINATEQSQRVTITTSTTAATPWSLTIPASVLQPGNTVNVRTTRTLTGGGNISCPNSFSSASNFLTVQGTTAAPSISPVTCGKITTLSGTSTEPAGTVIQFYTNGTAGARDGSLITQSGTSTPLTATVSATGTWSVDLSSAAGGGIAAGTPVTARAKAVGKVRSVNSAAVTSTAAPTGTLTIASPITEGQTTITGTAPAGSQVTVYIEGTPFSPVTTNSNGIWTASGFSSLEVFAGASVTANYKLTGNNCASEKIAPVIVQCSPPSSSPTVTPSALTICSGGTAQVTVNNSEAGVAYRLITVSGTTETETGNSVLGTGGAITLTSFPITSATTLRVRARKVSGTACTTILSGSTNVTVNTPPANTNTLTIGSSSGCAGLAQTITVAGTQTGLSYQLINSTTKAPIAVTSGDTNPKAGNGSSITFNVASVSTTTTFGILVTNTTTGCSAEGTNTVTYTVTGPAANQEVSLSTTKTCSGSPAIVYVQTNNDGATYQLYRSSDNAKVGTAFTGTGQRQAITVSPTVTTTFYVTASVSGGCTVTLANRVTLEVSATFAPVTAGTAQTVCSSTASLQGSDPAPGTGRWSVRSKPTGSADPTFTAATSAATTVTGLVSGSYTFTWTVTSSCGGSNSSSSADVTVVVNCPAVYNIAPPKYREEYKVNDVLATVSDPDGAISQANVVTGSGSLPAGASLLANGNIVVANASEGYLMPGTYNFSVRTRDANGVETVTPITLRIYGTSPTLAPLPVELVYFKAVAGKGKVELQWLTASEKDNDRFEVERSSDGRTFSKIGTVKGKGDSNVAIKYNFTDKAPLKGTVYYRLKQVDVDGSFEYSNVVATSSGGSTTSDKLMQVYPNPFTSNVNVTLTVQQPAQTQLIIIDLQGREVLRKSVELDKGVNQIELPLQKLANGMYILKAVGGGIDETTKIIKNR
ncbi:beta strand repeat-containing protein [Pontibacter ruber]|uniref:T9SS type A sorting domain-containing protein n=1 Tax=Pontibacter ruber TaxID=1343895 RepID=A0ABW5CYZ6_9BACT|nr:T9SS type A sorting domain-containing protein [Pontibacter ruber]